MTEEQKKARIVDKTGVIDLMAPMPKDWEPITHMDAIIYADGTTNRPDINEELRKKRAAEDFSD